MGFRVSGRRMWVALAVATPLTVLAIMASGYASNLTASPVAAITNEASNFSWLRGAKDITTAEISGRTYALITSWQTNSVQIIDITDPASLVPVTWLTGGTDGFAEWDESHDIAITEMSGRTYALITTNDLRGSVQIVEMARPYG